MNLTKQELKKDIMKLGLINIALINHIDELNRYHNKQILYLVIYVVIFVVGTVIIQVLTPCN